MSTRGTIPLVVAALAGIVAAGLMYVLTALAGLGQAMPLLLPGPLVGLSVRLLSGGASQRVAGMACAIACIAGIAGFVASDTAVWTPFMLDQTLRRLFSLTGVILLAFTSYLAFVIAYRGH